MGDTFSQFLKRGNNLQQIYFAYCTTSKIWVFLARDPQAPEGPIKNNQLLQIAFSFQREPNMSK